MNTASVGLKSRFSAIIPSWNRQAPPGAKVGSTLPGKIHLDCRTHQGRRGSHSSGGGDSQRGVSSAIHLAGPASTEKAAANCRTAKRSASNH